MDERRRLSRLRVTPDARQKLHSTLSQAEMQQTRQNNQHDRFYQQGLINQATPEQWQLRHHISKQANSGSDQQTPSSSHVANSYQPPIYLIVWHSGSS